MELWDKIKQKTTYRVQFDLGRLVEDCVKEIKEMPQITPAKLLSQTAQIKIEQSGVYTQQNAMTTQELDKNYDALPDILRLISTKTLLTRSTILRNISLNGKVNPSVIGLRENVQPERFVPVRKKALILKIPTIFI